MKPMIYYAMFIFVCFTGGSAYADPPGDFTLVSPFNYSTGVDRQPAFQWNMSTGALSYKLQISETEDFSANWVAQESNLTSTSVTLTRKLTANWKYYWRVVAFSGWDNTGNPKSSPVWNFTTLNEPPAIPTLLWLVLENTETGGEPKQVQFEECNSNDINNFSTNPPTTYTRGQTVATTGDDGDYVHMDAFPTGAYSGNWNSDRTTSRNTL